jgi:hypothetical protein
MRPLLVEILNFRPSSLTSPISGKWCGRYDENKWEEEDQIIQNRRSREVWKQSLPSVIQKHSSFIHRRREGMDMWIDIIKREKACREKREERHEDIRDRADHHRLRVENG